jgi:aminoglycoside 6'-N-acetyltransferase I
MNVAELTITDLEEIKELFRSVFTAPPWNEDWSDGQQLDEYMRDLIEVRGSLLYGLFDSEQNLIGISLGKVKHWCGGTEYFIEEFCIRNEYQKKGCGKSFMEMIGESIKERGLNTIYLMTDRNQPAYNFYKKMGFQELPELTSFVKEI